ncbi:MAG: biopolymer transporter ExbD [Pirellulaceae bacterium]|nr:biopolymer transporter ExbD [Pirellulaceae bacterium]
MSIKRNTSKLLVEPAAVATGDIAFNLIVFFLVCASTQPDSGRKQSLPSSEKTKETQQDKQNIELALTRTRAVVSLNGDPVKLPELRGRLQRVLEGKTRSEDRVVVVKSKPDVPYDHWIAVTSLVQDVGASITIQREEEQTVTVGN